MKNDETLQIKLQKSMKSVEQIGINKMNDELRSILLLIHTGKACESIILM